MTIDAILAEFDSELDCCNSYAVKLSTLLSELCACRGIIPHSITSRVKTRDSLSRKIVTKNGKYQSLSDITDIVGLRLISYYADDVVRLAEIVEQEFVIDTANSFDKGALLDPDQFGYLSVHYVVSINHNRAALPEYESFQNIKAEIQVRSILQHAWAEIEHDIGYKSLREIPRHMHRRFSRLAGLLELADEEFIKLREESEAYKEAIPAQIKTNPNSAEIDLISLRSFIETSSLVQQLDATLNGILPLQFMEPTNQCISGLVRDLHYLKVLTIGSLIQQLTSHERLVTGRAQYEIELYGAKATANTRSVHHGISISYLCQVLAAKSRDKDAVIRFLNQQGFGDPKNRAGFAKFLLAARDRFEEA